MTAPTYRVGQRVRIVDVVEGEVSAVDCGFIELDGGFHRFTTSSRMDARTRTITILSEPRPEEPKGLGAVVEAGHRGVHKRIGYENVDSEVRLLWQRLADGLWMTITPAGCEVFCNWRHLIDPVVLSEGYTPEVDQ